MSWKDYFYFQKGDKLAIFILMILIVIAGVVTFAIKQQYKPRSFEESPYNRQFEEFVANLRSTEKLKDGETITLNSADTTDLKRIPGIGATYAKRIVYYRDSVNGFVNLNQLKNVKGINDKLFKKIAPYITIE